MGGGFSKITTGGPRVLLLAASVACLVAGIAVTKLTKHSRRSAAEAPEQAGSIRYPSHQEDLP